jgi:protein-tyrosine phosphatase
MIDLHSHILPGVDDGARTLEDSLDIARAALEDGITAIAATPHVRSDYPTSAGLMEERLAELRAELARRQIPLEVLPGGEIADDWIDRLSVEDLRRFGLAGNPRYLLVETPYYAWPHVLLDRLLSLGASGITPVLAHPERNAEVQTRPDLLVPLVRAGVLVQVTAASLDGRVGKRARACGLSLVEHGLAHLIGSDAHQALVRAAGLAEAARAVRSAELADWLTVGVPSAIVDDRRPPPRPDVRRRGWLGGLFRT